MNKSITLLNFSLMLSLSLQAAVPISKDTVPEKNGIGLRNAYDDPITGGPNAIISQSVRLFLYRIVFM